MDIEEALRSCKLFCDYAKHSEYYATESSWKTDKSLAIAMETLLKAYEEVKEAKNQFISKDIAKNYLLNEKNMAEMCQKDVEEKSNAWWSYEGMIEETKLLLSMLEGE